MKKIQWKLQLQESHILLKSAFVSVPLSARNTYLVLAVL